MGHPVTWFQVQGEDAKELQSFYKKVFAWKVRAQRGVGMGMVDAEAGGIGGGGRHASSMNSQRATLRSPKLDPVPTTVFEDSDMSDDTAAITDPTSDEASPSEPTQAEIDAWAAEERARLLEKGFFNQS